MKRVFLKKQVLFVSFLLSNLILLPQTFTEQTDIVLPGLSYGSTNWGDYDNDGDLDLLISGSNASNYATLKIFRNDGSNTFVDLGSALSPSFPLGYVTYGDNCTSSWVDFDNDGFLDIVAVSKDPNGSYYLIIYSNDGGTDTFTQEYELKFLTNQGGSTYNCGDYDCDGDMDIVFTGSISSKILENHGNFDFTEVHSVVLQGLTYSSSKWIDYDNDGDLDLMLTGNGMTLLYGNNGNNNFIKNTETSFKGVSYGTNEWGDYDNDGLADLLLTGTGPYSSLYKNNGDNTFTYQEYLNLQFFWKGFSKWGDLDNDGDLDIIIAGDIDYGEEGIKIFINNGDGTFSEPESINITPTMNGSAGLGDYDNDGDLDIVISGENGPERICKVYMNESAVTNPVPEAPDGPDYVSAGDSVILKWNPVITDNTAATALSYNLMVGTVSGGTDLVNPSSSSSGFRRISAMGNGQMDTTFVLRNIKPGTYYWKVQAVDNSYKGGLFSSEATIIYSSSYQAYSLTVFEAGGSEADISWTRGNGDNCIVFVKEGDTGTAYPSDNITYTASSSFGSGSQIGSTGWYCVYNGSQNSVHITGLSALTDYMVQVQEYTGSPSSETYNNDISDENLTGFTTGIFTELYNVHLESVNYPSLNLVPETDKSWFDIDNDNDLDLLITGNLGQYLYENTGGGTFTELSHTLSNGPYAACADYNNDGFIDIAILDDSGTTIHLNNGDKTFTQLPGTSITGVRYGSIDWGDYDNDGDYDIIITGDFDFSHQGITEIYRNNGDETFTKITDHNLPGIRYGSTDWGDYDNDGYLDLALSGIGLDGSHITKVFKNDTEGSFEETDINQYLGSVKWGDYDCDGDLDLLFISSSGNKIYRNQGNDTFSRQDQIDISRSDYGSGAWGDFDNDGYLDILVTGFTNSYIPFSKLFRNNKDNTFQEDTSVVLTPAGFSNSACGDFDGDNDLDIIIMGVSEDSAFTRIFRNDINIVNPAPETPSGLSSEVNKSEVVLKWNSIRTDNTDYQGISYNITLGTTSGGFDAVSPHSSYPSGFRRIARMGTANLDTVFYIKDLPFGTYWWSVQAVDNSFTGGPFSGEDNFSIVPVQASNLTATILSTTSLLLKWERGNGTRCIVFCKETATGTAVPVDNETYLPDSEYGYGEQLGSTGWYCIYNGRSDSVVITGLTYKTDYSFHIIEYLGSPGSEQYFTEIVDGNPGVFSTGLFSEQTGITLTESDWGIYSWGDFNNDGLSDIIIPGSPSVLYENNGDNTFSTVGTVSFPEARYGTTEWADYDNDGDLDLLISGAQGYSPNILPITKIYRNDGSGIFIVQDQIILEQVYYSAADWGDYDNDGDIDLVLTGATGNDPYYDPVTKIYRNNGDSTFTEQTDIVLTGVYMGDAKWVDYDNDGDLDLSYAGTLDYQYSNSITRLYRNDGNNTFTEQTETGFPDLWEASIEWGDYDNDGDMDVVMTQPGVLYAYRNDQNSFTKILNEYYGYSSHGCVRWGDFDNDGFLDILFSNFSASAIIFKNYNGEYFSEFDDESFVFTQVDGLEWCDYDNDSDIDILVCKSNDIVKLYKNNLYMKSGQFIPNSMPSAPSGTEPLYTPEGIKLRWDPVTDDETAPATMSYNVGIGTAPGTFDICPPHTGVSGYRQIIRQGNAQLDTCYLVKNLPQGKYYWQVQAVDQAYMGGPWSPVDSFEVKNVQAFYDADEVCFGYPTTFTDNSVASDGIAAWYWDFNDGNTSAEQNPVYQYSASGIYNVKLVITDNGGSKDSLTQAVTVLPRPITGFSAPDVCQGIPVTATNTTDNNSLTITSWYWDFGDGTTSAEQQPAPHGYLNTGDYTLKLRAVASNGCADSVANIVSVGAYPVAAVTANGPLTFCKGESVTLSVPYVDGYQYTWKIDDTNLTEGDSSRYVAGLTGDYSVEIVNPKGNCTTNSAAVGITAQDAPAAPLIDADGDLEFCQGDSVLLTVTNTSGYTYQWKLNGGAVGTDSSQYAAKSSGVYSLTVSNSTGCSADAANTINVIVNPAPSLPTVSLSGPTTFCEGDSVVLSVTNNAAYSYQWENNNTSISGATSNSHKALASGSYTLVISNSGGCMTMTAPVDVSVKPMPYEPEIASDNYTAGDCMPETPVRLSVDQEDPGYSYQWYRNGIPVTGSTLSYIEDFLSEGDYSLMADLNGCTAESDAITIAYKDAPEKPSLSAQGPSVWYLICGNTSAAEYKWYCNDKLITDADDYYYIAGRKMGEYQVSIRTEAGGCFTRSDIVTIPTGDVGMDDVDPFEDLSIYPNPTNGLITIEIDNNLLGELQLSIISENGKELLSENLDKTTQHFFYEVDLSGQPQGLYIINLIIDRYFTTRKVIVE